MDVREEGSTLIYREGLGTLITSMKSGGCKVDARSVCFRAFRGEISPPKVLNSPSQTITKFVDVFHIFSSHKSNFPPPQNYISGKNPEHKRGGVRTYICKITEDQHFLSIFLTKEQLVIIDLPI